jgi:alpha-1,2-mannosyltransferase
MRYLRTPLFIIAIISLFFLGIEWKTILHQPAPGTDFSIYYRAAGLFGSDPSGLYMPPQAAWDQYLYPPPSILIFRFFHLFPERTSYLLFIGIMYGCLIAALLVGQSLYERDDSHPYHGNLQAGSRRPGEAGYIIFALASAPVYHNIGLGQIECLVLLLSMLYLYFLKSRPLLAGILLAAAIWIKMYPVLLLFPAFFSREGRKTILTCLLGGIGIMVITLPFIPFHLYIDFSKKLEAVSQYTSSNIINQSVIAFGLRLIVPFRQAFEWPNIYQIPEWLKGINYALLGLILVLAGVKTIKEKAISNPLLPGAIMLSLGAAFSPLGWGHTFVFSLPLWILSMKKIEKTVQKNIFSWGILLAMALLCLIPVYNHPRFLDSWPIPVQVVYYSRFLIITLLLAFYCMFERPQPQLQKISDR